MGQLLKLAVRCTSDGEAKASVLALRSAHARSVEKPIHDIMALDAGNALREYEGVWRQSARSAQVEVGCLCMDMRRTHS